MSETGETVRFDVLGAVRVWAGAQQVAMPDRERTLLATLVLSANELVGWSRLIDAIWGERPPRDARNQLHGCVSRLRKRLAAAGVPGRSVVTYPAGYELRVASEHIDLCRFRNWTNQARAAAASGEHSAAVAAFHTALACWRGPALAGMDSELLRQAATSLDEERVRATEERIDLQLAQGAAGELVAELTDLVAQHPYRERLHAALMVALQQDGRRADALAAYQRVHRLLIDEIGTEPGPVLRELHQRILKDDQPVRLTRSRTSDDATPRARRCLPRSVGDFTGRADAVDQLIELATQTSTVSTVIAIDGMAGIGKTTLAVHVAHVLSDRYPDAQLFIDLQGHSEHRPLEPLAALDSLLRQLGVAGGRIPPDLVERESFWRGEAAGRRMLVVLDNAASSEQVTPLLPGEPGCLVLVTSRRKLSGLDSTYPLSLDQLPESEATVLLAKVVGDRVREQPEAAAQVVRSCGYLPLAIRLAGTRLAHRPTWQVADLARKLLGASGLLTELVAETRTVADAFALSYSQLAPTLQRAFRLLGLHPGDDFDVCAAAALIDCSLDAAQRALDALVDHHLLSEPSTGRFRFHDLVREFAGRLSNTDGRKDDQSAALQRLLDFYLHATTQASRPMRVGGNSDVEARDEARRPDLVSVASAGEDGWLESERANIVSAVAVAFTVGAYRYSWRLARAAWEFNYYRGYLDELLETHRCGLAAAERLTSDTAIATMCNYLASAHYKRGELVRAEELLTRALSLRERSNDHAGVTSALTNLGLVFHRQGRLTNAIECYQLAFDRHQRSYNLPGMAKALQNLGVTCIALGRYKEATNFHRRRMAICRERGDVAGMTHPLASLGAIRTRLGDYVTAKRFLTISLRLCRRVGNRQTELVVNNYLGVLYRNLGRWREAIVWHREALAVAQEIGDVAYACLVRNDLGLTLREGGEVAAALEQHRSALAAATRLGLKLDQARALDGIAGCLPPSDRPAARRYWQQALVLYKEVGVPEQAEVERRLVDLAMSCVCQRSVTSD